MDSIHSVAPTGDAVSGAHGHGGKRGKRWSAEARAACVRSWREEGRRIRDLANEYRVTPETIRRWSRQVDDHVPVREESSATHPGFVALRLPEEVAASGIRIRSPDGWVVNLPAGSPSETIIRVVRGLRS